MIHYDLNTFNLIQRSSTFRQSLDEFGTNLSVSENIGNVKVLEFHRLAWTISFEHLLLN